MPVIIHVVEDWTAEDQEAWREYLEAHQSLPGQPEVLPVGEVVALARRLWEPRLEAEEKKRIMVFLAHHGSTRAALELERFAEQAGPKLRRFARLAFEEASQLVSAASHRLGRSGPCPCGSGRKLKDCCARRMT